MSKQLVKSLFALFLALSIIVAPVTLLEGTNVFGTQIVADAASAVWNGKAAGGFASGKGTKSSPYIIKTAEQLAYLQATVNNSVSYVGKYIRLDNDIVLNDTSNYKKWSSSAPKNKWTSIGRDFYKISSVKSASTFKTAEKKYGTLYYANSDGSYYYSEYEFKKEHMPYYVKARFNGYFDGNNHTVSGVYINSTGTDCRGLFGYLEKGYVKNLGITKSYIAGKSFVGGVAAFVESNAYVSKCFNKSSTVKGTDRVGGVVGYSYLQLSNSYNTGSVNGNDYVGGVAGNIASSNAGMTGNYNTGSVSGHDYVGGVAGYIYQNHNVSKCYNTGTVKGNEYVGGVFGDMAAKAVSSVYNKGSVTGQKYVGGVCSYGYIDSVKSSYNTGNIQGTDYVGGVFARLHTQADADSLYNTGKVSGSDTVGGVIGSISSDEGSVIYSHNKGIVEGKDSYCGGVIGNASCKEVNDCYNTGTIIGHYYTGGVIGNTYECNVSYCNNSAEITAYSQAAGIIGYASDSKAAYCYNVGPVTSDYCAGGIIGSAYSTDINDCYNRAQLNATSDYAGGIAGRLSNGTISSCYNVGSVIYDGDTYTSAGGVCGYQYNANVANCYYEYNCIDRNNSLGVPVYKDTMSLESTFSGFDFDKVWTFEGSDEGYYYPTFHSFIITKAVAATCEKSGLTAGRKCANCGKVVVKQKNVAAKGHKYTSSVSKATTSADGRITKTCSRCDKITKTTIPKIKSIKLKTTKYSYNGKAKSPAVEVKDSKGKVLKKGTDYTVKYSKNTAIGTASAVVTFKGNYYGTKTLTFKIVPAAPSVSVTSPAKRSAKLTWGKVSGASSYVIYYSRSKSSGYSKLYTTTGTSYTNKNLTSGRTYYFKVIATKKVGSTSYNSSYSAVKSVKVK